MHRTDAIRWYVPSHVTVKSIVLYWHVVRVMQDHVTTTYRQCLTYIISPISRSHLRLWLILIDIIAHGLLSAQSSSILLLSPPGNLDSPTDKLDRSMNGASQ